MQTASSNKIEQVANLYWAVSLATRNPWLHGKGWTIGRVINSLRDVCLYVHPLAHNLNRQAGELLEQVIADEDDPIREPKFIGHSEVVPLRKDCMAVTSLDDVRSLHTLVGKMFMMQVQTSSATLAQSSQPPR